jgi:hypothetical protein
MNKFLLTRLHTRGVSRASRGVGRAAVADAGRLTSVPHLAAQVAWLWRAVPRTTWPPLAAASDVVRSSAGVVWGPSAVDINGQSTGGHAEQAYKHRARDAGPNRQILRRLSPVCLTQLHTGLRGFSTPAFRAPSHFCEGKKRHKTSGAFRVARTWTAEFFILSCGSFPFSPRAGRRRRAAEAASRMRGIRIAQLCHRPSPGAQKSAPASPHRRGEAREFALARTPAALFGNPS